MTLRKLLISLLIIALLSAAGYWGYLTYLAPRETETAPTAAATPSAESTSDTVSAEGVVVPVREAEIGFVLPGRLEEWLVSEGETVAAGAVLARMAAPDIAESVAQAEAALAIAEAQLAQARAGARTQELAAAEANVRAAEEQVASARSGVAQAQSRVAEAQAALDAARARLAQAERGATPEELRVAEGNLAKAESAVKQAQAAYDEVAYRPDIAALPQSLALEEATQNLAIARAEYDRVRNGATEEELDALRAEVSRAEALLQAAQAAVEAANTQVSSAQAAADQAKAQYDLLAAGARPEEIALLEAQVAQARAALDQARAIERETELRAPFDGTLVHQLLEVGEPVIPNQPVARFGDITTLQVETDDLSEVNIAPVREGQSATVTFDALPGVEVGGKVLQIRPVAETKRGDTTYTVVISLDEQPEELRWGMTAFVDIRVR